LIVLHGILKRAKRKCELANNLAEDVERISVQRSGDFNVLTPVEVAAVARSTATEQDAALLTVMRQAGWTIACSPTARRRGDR
jgi:hypothetical protein